MFHASQCKMSVLELFCRTGSVSCMSRTKLCVPIGTCDHFNSGDTAIGPAFCVYLSGITPPSSKDVVVMRSGGVCGPRAPPRPWPPAPCPRSWEIAERESAINATKQNRTCTSFLCMIYSPRQKNCAREILLSSAGIGTEKYWEYLTGDSTTIACRLTSQCSAQ